MSKPLTTSEAIARLCPECGLCCNGVLFADVRLQSADEPARLREIGVELKGQLRLRLAQPCACFDGKLCRIYAGRPARCAQFECGVLKRVQSGELSEAAGLQKIRETRGKVERVKLLLREAGNAEERLPLTKRYARVMSQPVDLAAGDNAARHRGKLMRAVAELMKFLQREFLR